nr:MAG TPA: hypothetical protein [Caudoviricetes sp.]
MCVWLLLRRISACEGWFGSHALGLWRKPRPLCCAFGLHQTFGLR